MPLRSSRNTHDSLTRFASDTWGCEDSRRQPWRISLRRSALRNGGGEVAHNGDIFGGPHRRVRFMVRAQRVTRERSYGMVRTSRPRGSPVVPPTRVAVGGRLHDVGRTWPPQVLCGFAREQARGNGMPPSHPTSNRAFPLHTPDIGATAASAQNGAPFRGHEFRKVPVDLTKRLGAEEQLPSREVGLCGCPRTRAVQ